MRLEWASTIIIREPAFPYCLPFADKHLKPPDAIRYPGALLRLASSSGEGFRCAGRADGVG